MRRVAERRRLSKERLTFVAIVISDNGKVSCDSGTNAKSSDMY